jgi:hypothetical protein
MLGTLKFSIVSLGYLRSANIILPASLGDKNVSVAIFVQVDKDVGVVAHLGFRFKKTENSRFLFTFGSHLLSQLLH